MLLKTAEDIKNNFSHAQNNIVFASWKSSINISEKQDIIPYIGQAFYNELNSQYNAEPPTLSAENQTLLEEYLQPCLAYYTAKEYIKPGSVIIGEIIGITRNTNIEPLTPEECKMAKMMLLDSADILLESMLAFLEENKTDYPTWANSIAYTEEKTLFIRNAVELNEWVSLGAGNPQRRLYLKIKSELRNAEKILERNLTKDFFDALKAKHIAGTLTTEEQKIIDLSKPYLASVAMSHALPTFAKYWQYVFFGGELKEKQMKIMKEEYKERSEERTADLLSYLNGNADDYPLFKESDNYIEPPTQGEETTDNSNSTVFFV